MRVLLRGDWVFCPLGLALRDCVPSVAVEEVPEDSGG